MGLSIQLTSILLLLTATRTGQNAIESVSIDNEQNLLANAINEFGYKLLVNMMKNDEHRNIVISPTGIAGLLAMTLLGSVGAAYDELAVTLGFSQDILTNRKNHEQLGDLLQGLNANDTASRTTYADAIFVDAHTQLREAYRSYLRRVYKADAVSADFGDKVTVRDQINQWVENNTNGHIRQFLKQTLPSETKVVLLSALYFSGQWSQPFIPEYTKKMPFMKTTGEIMTDFMLNFGEFDYIFSSDYGLQMIALPYNDSVTKMYVVKPRNSKRMDLSQLMDQINYSTIQNLINEMTTKKCVVRFPKMELKASVKLEKSLKALGVESIFNSSEANFALMVDGKPQVNKTEEEIITRINSRELNDRGLKDLISSLPNPGVYVDSVLHDVKISINEYGTEAVAATSGLLARTDEQFYANSPFYMFIRNERTKLVTFSAVIFDPET